MFVSNCIKFLIREEKAESYVYILYVLMAFPALDEMNVDMAPMMEYLMLKQSNTHM